MKLVSRHHSDPSRSRPQNGVATSIPNRPGRDVNSMLRPPFQPTLCRDIDFMLRPPILQPLSRHQIYVATPFLPSLKPGWDTRTRSRPPGRPTYVATSFSCRDLVPAQHEISKSRSQTPGRDLPRCYPCRDINFMTRHKIPATTRLMSRHKIYVAT